MSRRDEQARREQGAAREPAPGGGVPSGGVPGGASGRLDDVPGADLRGTPRFFEYWNRLDAVNWMGVRIVETAEGRARAVLEPEKHHRGAGLGGRAVTGATQAYIFDFVTGAAVSSLTHGALPQVTVQLECRYYHPAYDAPLSFEAHVQHAGRQVVFVEATCTDANGLVCSRANAVYYRFDKRPRTHEPSQPPAPSGSDARPAER